MERTTCFKLCYALGVSEVELEECYPVECRVAFQLGEFKATSAVDRFRELSRFYFNTMGCYEAGLLAPLQAAIEEHNRMLTRVHLELEIQIPLNLFAQITRLPTLDAKTAVQIAFLMSKTTHLHGLYFWQNELLNVALGTMLRDDLAFRDRLCLISGDRLGPLFDQSTFGAAVRSYLDAVFVSKPEDLGCPVFRYDGNGLGLNYRLWSARAPQTPQVQEVTGGCTVVTQDAHWVSKQAVLHPDVNFVLVLPIESKFYRVWRKRLLPNIYLLSLKE